MSKLSGVGCSQIGARRPDKARNGDVKVKLACYFTEEQAEWLKKQADRNGVSVARIIRICVDKAGDK